jgi:hypothetical protein
MTITVERFPTSEWYRRDAISFNDQNVPVGRYSTDTNRAWAWDHESNFPKATLHGVDPADINRLQAGAANPEHMLTALGSQYHSADSSHPNTIHWCPPYSILVWADFGKGIKWMSLYPSNASGSAARHAAQCGSSGFPGG